MEANKTKRTKLIIIAVVIALVAAIAAIIYISGSSGRELKKQLDLGHKYLLEQNYEQAILCFKKAIEIDPMCEDAYLSMADAYVGIDDFDNAMSLLEDAIKLFEDNGLDATALKEKLEKIRAERELKEKEKAEEEERKRIAELPYIEIQPILDCLDNVWGRKWTDWTMEDYIKEFNLEYHTYDGDEWWKEKDSPDYFHGAAVYEDGVHQIYQCGKRIKLNDGYSLLPPSVYLDFRKEGIRFWQAIYANMNNESRVIKDYLYSYTSKNGIDSVKTAKSFWGIEKDGESEINTDLGIGRVWCRKEDIYVYVNEYVITIYEFSEDEDEYVEKITTMQVELQK